LVCAASFADSWGFRVCAGRCVPFTLLVSGVAVVVVAVAVAAEAEGAGAAEGAAVAVEAAVAWAVTAWPAGWDGAA